MSTLLWQTRGAIKVAVERVEIAPLPLQRTPIPQMIACEFCGARTSEMCRTANGNTRAPHAQRLAPRCCPCGNKLKPRHDFCDGCARARNQASKNQHGARCTSCSEHRNASRRAKRRRP